jgi:hypothetical protein
MQLKKRWERESSSVLQRGQRDFDEGIWKIAFNLALEGRRSQAIFQRNKINLAFSLSFHKAFHELDLRGEITEVVLGLLMNIYAELVEKRQLVEGVQRKDVDKVWLMGIFRISLTQGDVNKETRRERFHEPLGVIKSETIKSRNEYLLIRGGLGEKKRQSRNPRGIPNRKRGRTMNPMAWTLR